MDTAGAAAVAAVATVAVSVGAGLAAAHTSVGSDWPGRTS